MFRLDRHIEILLMKHDCVILPGFGGFVAHHVSAHLDDTDGVMIPPKTIVGFNPRLTFNDSLLVQSYAETYDYSLPEALNIVEEEISMLRNMIQEEGHCELSIGELLLNNDGSYEFAPISSGIAIPAFYGLGGIDTNDTECFATKRGHENSNRAKSAMRYMEDEGEEHVIKISTKVIRRMAVACMVIFLMVSLPFVNSNTNTKELLGGINFNQLYKLMPKIEVIKKDDTKVQTVSRPIQNNNIRTEKTQISTTENNTDTSCETSLQATNTQPAYTVVLASMVSARNAAIFVDQLHAKGLTEAKVIGEGKNRKVVYGNYNNEEEAQQVKRKLSSNYWELTSAWVTKLQ